MIRLKLPAEMACDAEGCTASAEAKLILLPTGGLGFAPVPTRDAWQVQVNRNNPMSPYVTRCPKHAQTVLPIQPKVIADAH